MPKNTQSASTRSNSSRAMAGWIYGLVGMLGFSLTLPATRIAVAELDPQFVAFGRALVAAVPATVLLLINRGPMPSGSQWRALGGVALGVVVGFPLLTAWAMQSVPANHGAVVIAVLPLATAVVAALRNGERHSYGFWIWCILGALLVAVYALRRGNGQLHLADLALLGAVASAAWGYAEGARLTPILGGWRVISWALVLSAPPLALVLALGPRSELQPVSAHAWLAFAYVALISQFLAFFAWYRGLALGGVARVAQLQLLMPFCTLAASAALLGEQIPVSAVLFAVLVLGTVAMGARSGQPR